MIPNTVVTVVDPMYFSVWDLILPYLQANKLNSYYFMDAGRRHKTLESEKRGLCYS